MPQTNDSQPDGRAAVHLAVFIGSGGVGQTPTYWLTFACDRDPEPGDVVTTASADATCRSCLEWKHTYEGARRRTLP